MLIEMPAKKTKPDLPLVSVITLAYNNFRYLPETIDSVLDQSYPNIELIVSDDAGSDFEPAWLKTYIEEKCALFGGRIVIRQNAYNMGTVRNANAAIAEASGKYIKLLSSGDSFASSCALSFLVEKMEANRWKIANSLSAVYNEDMSSLQGYYPKRKVLRKMGRMSADGQYLMLTGYNVTGACGVIFTRELFSEIGGFDEAYFLTEDWPAWLKITRLGIKIEAIDFVSVKYRLGGISRDGAKNPVLRKDLVTMMEGEILCHRELFSNQIWKDLQTQYNKALYWNNFSTFQKIGFLIEHWDYFVRHKFMVRN